MTTILMIVGVFGGLALLAKKGAKLPSGAGLGESGGGSPLAARPSARIAGILDDAHARHPGIERAFFYASAALESRFAPGVQRFDSVERSAGLFQVNTNAWGAKIRSVGGESPDSLYDPAFCAEFWATQIVEPLAARADRKGYAGDRKWEAVRSWLASPGFDPDNPASGAQKYIARFRPVYAAWKERLT